MDLLLHTLNTSVMPAEISDKLSVQQLVQANKQQRSKQSSVIDNF